MDRESAKKEGWQYEKSNHEAFNEFAFRTTKDGIEVWTSDKVHYAPSEVKALPENGVFPIQVHLVKKLFNGIIEEHESVR